MSPLNFTHILTQAVDELSESESYQGLFHQHKDGEPLPSARVLCDIIELARSILFPGYYGNSTVNSRTLKYHIGVNTEKLLIFYRSKFWLDYALREGMIVMDAQLNNVKTHRAWRPNS